jgi:hypothetical protein
MEKTIKRWYRKVWITRGSRFNAHSRLEYHADLSNLSISILTVYIIALNLFPQISFLKTRFKSEDTGYITIILSVLILSISQYVSSKEYKLKAVKFHNCGKELSEIYEELSLYNDDPNKATFNDIKSISDRYHSIIDKYDENHSKLDQQIFICDNINEFPLIKNPTAFILKITFFSFCKGQLIYWSFILLPPMIFFFWCFK